MTIPKQPQVPFADWTVQCKDTVIRLAPEKADPVENVDLNEIAARAMATYNGLDWDEICGLTTEAEECDSGTCLGSILEDHDREWAREIYMHQAGAAVAATEPIIRNYWHQQGFDDGSEKEREQIIAWLRTAEALAGKGPYKSLDVPIRLDCIRNIIDAIESGHCSGFPATPSPGAQQLSTQGVN